MFEELSEELLKLYGFIAKPQFDAGRAYKCNLEITISSPTLSDEIFALDFEPIRGETLESTITRFKQDAFREWGCPNSGRFGNGVEFKTVFNKMFSSHDFRSDNRVSVFFTDHYPQYGDFSCHKLFTQDTRYKGSSWQPATNSVAEEQQFHDQHVGVVKQAVLNGIEYHYSEHIPFPVVGVTDRVKILVPENAIDNNQMSLSYVEYDGTMLMVAVYKFDVDRLNGTIRNWGIKYEYVANDEGLLSIKTIDAIPKAWMESIKKEQDFEEHPYNVEIHGMLGDVGKPIYVGDNVWVTKGEKLFVRINNTWTPIDLGYAHYAEKFLPENIYKELQMVVNTINISKK